MSLPWRDEVGVYLSPRRLVMVRLQRGLRPKTVLEMCYPVEPLAPNDWRAAVGSLAAHLAEPAWAGGGTTWVVTWTFASVLGRAQLQGVDIFVSGI